MNKKYLLVDKTHFLNWVKQRMVTNENGCWLVQTNLDRNSYVTYTFSLNGKQIQINNAHRLSYFLLVDNIPKNKVVMHSCGNRNCVSPFCLSPGTIKENVQTQIADKTHTSVHHKRKKLSQQETDLCMKLLSEGRSDYFISKQIGITMTSVGNRRRVLISRGAL